MYDAHMGRLAVPCSIAIAAALAAGGTACAKDTGKTPPAAAKQSVGAAYIEQLGAPHDWMTNSDFWIEADTLKPADKNQPRVVIADPGNVQRQAQTGTGHSEFVFQWGRGNEASQVQSGTRNRAEVVQVSPGAARGKGANAGAGNGVELDIFGFEIDPGNSQGHNRSPEGGGAGAGINSAGNLSLQNQAGADNFARTVQIGTGNAVEELQAGNLNASIVVQIGADNRARTEQAGRNNDSVIVQQGTGNVAAVRQGED